MVEFALPMFCSKCGAQASASARYCSSCGRVLDLEEGTTLHSDETAFEGETIPLDAPAPSNSLESPRLAGIHEDNVLQRANGLLPSTP